MRTTEVVVKIMLSKNSALNRIRNNYLYETEADHLEHSCEANWELAILRIRGQPADGGSTIEHKYETYLDCQERFAFNYNWKVQWLLLAIAPIFGILLFAFIIAIHSPWISFNLSFSSAEEINYEVKLIKDIWKEDLANPESPLYIERENSIINSVKLVYYFY